jgi:hypothetical protein
MGDIYTRMGVILAKSETSYGVDSLPTEVDAIMCSAPEQTISGDKRDRNVIRASLSPVGFGIGAKRQTIKFSVELKGANVPAALSTLTQLDPLFKACGHVSDVHAGPPAYVGYSPETNPNAVDSCTIYFYMKQNLYSLVGCYGTASLNFSTDGYPSVDFTMTGFYDRPKNQVKPAGIVFEAHDPPACLDIGMTIGAFAPIGVSKLAMDLGVKISERKDMQDPTGLSAIRITGREAKLTLECDVELLTVWNPYTNWESGTKEAIAFSVGPPGNCVSVSAPTAQIEEPKTAQRDDQMVYQLSFLLTGEDDEYLIKTH